MGGMQGLLSTFTIAAALTLGHATPATANGDTADAAPTPAQAIRPYTLEDFLQHPHTTRSYVEAWYYELHLDSGEILQIHFCITNLGLFSGRCGVQATLMKPGEAGLSLGRELPPERFAQDSDIPRLTFGEHAWIHGLPPDEHAIHFAIGKGPGIELTAAFSNMIPGFVVGDGVILFDRPRNAKVAMMVAIPRARFTGVLTVGGLARAVSGWAYSEHAYQTLRTKGFLGHRLQFRQMDARHSVSMSLLQTNDRQDHARIQIAFVTDNTRVLAVFPGIELSVSPDALCAPLDPGSTLSARAWTDDASLTAAWHEDAFLHRFRLTEQMNPILACVVQGLVGDPVFYRFAARADMELTLDGRLIPIAGTGFREVSFMP